MCPEHEMEKVNMYCEVCKRPVCHLCKLGGSHANHKVTSMSNAYKILKVPHSDEEHMRSTVIPVYDSARELGLISPVLRLTVGFQFKKHSWVWCMMIKPSDLIASLNKSL